MLSFGARYCDAVSSIQLSFVSLSDGQMHHFKPEIALPNDNYIHRYQLDWLAESDSYAIHIDDIPYKSGKITDAFDGFYTVTRTEGSKPRDWDDQPYFANEALQDKLASIDKYIPDPDAVIPPYTDINMWEPD